MVSQTTQLQAKNLRVVLDSFLISPHVKQSYQLYFQNMPFWSMYVIGPITSTLSISTATTWSQISSCLLWQNRLLIHLLFLLLNPHIATLHTAGRAIFKFQIRDLVHLLKNLQTLTMTSKALHDPDPIRHSHFTYCAFLTFIGFFLFSNKQVSFFFRVFCIFCFLADAAGNTDFPDLCLAGSFFLTYDLRCQFLIQDFPGSQFKVDLTSSLNIWLLLIFFKVPTIIWSYLGELFVYLLTELSLPSGMQAPFGRVLFTIVSTLPRPLPGI